MIDPIMLGEEELDTCFKVMRKGNTQLRTLAKLTGMEDRKFRAKLFKDGLNDWTEEQHAQIAQAMPDIQAVRNIEWKMMRQFSRLARKLSNSWSKKLGGSAFDKEDYLQEALMALLDAIYGYTDEDTQFITFAWWIIRNRLTTAANKDNPFSPLTNEAMGLLKRFDEAKLKLNRYATDQDVYDACGFTEEECKVIREAQVKVYNASAIKDELKGGDGSQGFEGSDTSGDYTAQRSGIDREKDTVVVSYEVRDAVKRARLTTMERKVIEAAMQASYRHGWQTDFAENNVCEATGKPYSRQRIMQVYQRALEKIEVALGRKAVA